MLAFRSVVIPIKAAVMNLLSVAAAYGVVTAVFQEGWGFGAVGLPHAIPIVSFAPLLMFAILFGLSMDYEVFLVTQMQEHYLESGDAKEAVVDGLAATGRVITSAALVMVCVFSSFVLNGDPTVKEFGVGLAFAIAVDATIVRCLLVPAVMELLGERSWWIPSWLDRVLPRVSIEGQGFFDDASPPPAPEPEPAPAPQTNVLPERVAAAPAPAGGNPTPDEGVEMSVIMMLRVKADPKRLQEVINGDESRTQAVNDAGQGARCDPPQVPGQRRRQRGHRPRRVGVGRGLPEVLRVEPRDRADHGRDGCHLGARGHLLARGRHDRQVLVGGRHAGALRRSGQLVGRLAEDLGVAVDIVRRGGRHQRHVVERRHAGRRGSARTGA